MHYLLQWKDISQKNIWSYQNLFCFTGFGFEVFCLFCFRLLIGLWVFSLFLCFTVVEKKIFQNSTVKIFSLHKLIMCHSSRKSDTKYKISIIPNIASNSLLTESSSDSDQKAEWHHYTITIFSVSEVHCPQWTTTAWEASAPTSEFIAVTQSLPQCDICWLI